MASVGEPVAEAGLSKEILKSNTELQLRKADIDVYTKEKWQNSSAGPVLFISITAQNRDGLLAYSILAELNQTVYTTAGNRTTGTTWKAIGSIGTTGADNVRDLTEPVRQKVRTFINDWLAAHEE